jgi:hypothetical protein
MSGATRGAVPTAGNLTNARGPSGFIDPHVRDLGNQTAAPFVVVSPWSAGTGRSLIFVDDWTVTEHTFEGYIAPQAGWWRPRWRELVCMFSAMASGGYRYRCGYRADAGTQ